MTATDQPRKFQRNDCTVCHSRQVHYAFSHEGYRIVRCQDCGLMFSNPQPTDTELGAIYTKDYFLGAESEGGRQATRDLKRTTARHYLEEIERYRGATGGKLLELGCGDGDFLVEAEAAGFEVTGVEYSTSACDEARARLKNGTVIPGEVEAAGLIDGTYDVCVLSDVIEHVRDPQATLRLLHRLLKPGGVIFIATPSLDSWSAKLLGARWMEWKAEHLTYFNNKTMQNALFLAGFRETIVQPGTKFLTFDYIAKHFEKFPVPFFSSVVGLVNSLLPVESRKKKRRIVASGLMAFARATAAPERKKLSVVIPAFNEAAGVSQVMEAVLAKEMPDLDIEAVVVESNSTDGTREAVLKYKDHPRVKIVLEDRPQGKGHAVRAGLKEATGDFILIQDADLEYDFEDYDVLLDPLINGREAFTLGARRGGGAWKMRQFTGQKFLSIFMNFGHVFFTWLVNILFLVRLRDPFTMFKVFRRDCLHGLSFSCNRFDFDFELLIKLLRKGYHPVEIPVNYRSRSFKEGKKVSMFRDPITWLKACVKLRFTRINPMREIVAQRAASAGKSSTETLPAQSCAHL